MGQAERRAKGEGDHRFGVYDEVLFRSRGERGKGKEVRSLLYKTQCQLTARGLESSG